MNTLNRREFLSLTAAGAMTQVAGGSQGGSGGEALNILLIITDQQSNVALSANGNPFVRTPAMDSLAAGGISFTQSYCTYPVCSPARSSLFTGRMPHETGVRANGQAILPGIATLGSIFQRSGYRTVYAGKWHVPSSFGQPSGFQQLFSGSRLGAEMDEGVAGASIDFLESEHTDPFLMVASFMNPHDICSWIRAHSGTRTHPNLQDFPPPRLNMAVDPEEPEYLQYHRTGDYNAMSNAVLIASDWDRDDFRAYLHAYYRMVEDVDRQIGRVLSVLRSTGLAANTLILLTSDHGEGLGSHRWVQKAAFWEETVKVPLVIAGAGVNPGGIDQQSLVSGLDVLPTLCDYSGVTLPAGVRGKSLRSVVEGSALERPFIVSELSEYGDASRQGRMLRSQRYKYVVFNGGERPEQLFDLSLDPGEIYNLAPRSEFNAALQQHRALLAGWMKETADDFA
ncbi:MAG: sulfatase family protein [Acidobacteriota bacterium]